MNIPSISTGAMASHQVIAALLFVKNELRFKSFRVVFEVGPLGLFVGGNVVQPRLFFQLIDKFFNFRGRR